MLRVSLCYFSGRSYAIYTQKMLNAALESLVQKVQSGVVINFEKIGDPPQLPDGLNPDSNGNLKGRLTLFSEV